MRLLVRAHSKQATRIANMLVILVAVGGRGTLVGAIIGAILVSLTKTIVNDEFKKAWPIVVGSIFVLVVVFMPHGLIGLVRGLPKRGRQLAGLTNRFLLLARSRRLRKGQA